LPGKRDEPDRAYRLRTDEFVPDGVRRIARGQLELARDELDGTPKRKQPKAVHEARKRIKRLRACVRLARDAIGEDTYERENDALRATARKLAAGRDAQVLLETIDALAERFADELPERSTSALRERLEDERERARPSGRDDEDVAAVLQALRQSYARVPAWTFQDDDFSALSPGLRRIYERGRKRMRTALDDPSPENLHEWRKRVKDLWHATQILRAARPKRLKRLSKRAHALADLLGDGHDLSLLRDYADAHPECFEDEDSRQALLAVIDRRAAVLREDALDCGRRLYEPSPKRFVKRVERGWHKRAARSPQRLAG
jgi:CHAD domain-containing protein